MLAYGSTYRSAASKYGSDSLTIKVAASGEERVAFGIIARGIGLRETADAVSAFAIKMFSDWFYERLRSGDAAFSCSDQIHYYWSEMHNKLRTRVRKFSSDRREEADVLIACALINTSPGYFCLMDTIGVGVYCIAGNGSKLIFGPDHWIASGSIHKADHSDERAPQWISTCLNLITDPHKPNGCNSGNDVRNTQARISQATGREVFLICTREIASNSCLEALAQHFRPSLLTGLLPMKMRLERLVRKGGLQIEGHEDIALGPAHITAERNIGSIGYNMGSAMVFKITGSGDSDA